jgi:hypothetical protein
MVQDRTCRQCGIVFIGGNCARYCPKCKVGRKREQDRINMQRLRAGMTRLVGSTDVCEMCGRLYNVRGARQQYCKICAPIHRAEYDRQTSRVYYHQHKNEKNPVRNACRRIGLVTCKWCGSEFDPKGTRRAYCTTDCAKKSRNKAKRERCHSKKYNRLGGVGDEKGLREVQCRQEITC